MDATTFRQTLERIDAALSTPTELLIRGGAALLALGFEGRSTVDIEVLPDSRFVDQDLQQACAARHDRCPAALTVPMGIRAGPGVYYSSVDPSRF